MILEQTSGEYAQLDRYVGLGLLLGWSTIELSVAVGPPDADRVYQVVLENRYLLVDSESRYLTA